jgi:hypothetical protein
MKNKIKRRIEKGESVIKLLMKRSWPAAHQHTSIIPHQLHQLFNSPLLPMKWNPCALHVILDDVSIAWHDSFPRDTEFV